MTSRGGSLSTISVSHVGRKDAVLGGLFGGVNAQTFQMLENLSFCSSDKKEAMDFTG
jgi:hypothetical protein